MFAFLVNSLLPKINKQDYLHDTGRFKGSAALVKNMCVAARAQGHHPDPLPMWARTQHASHPTPLAKLAKRLFLVCVNSASCEQLFSMFGIILSRLRSQLQPQVMTDLAELHLHQEKLPIYLIMKTACGRRSQRNWQSAD